MKCSFVLSLAAVLIAAVTVDASCANVTFATNYRKDHFLDYKQFPEAKIPSPVDGGRVHAMATLSTPLKDLKSVLVNNVPALGNLTASDPSIKYLDWARAHVLGDQFALSFHSRNTEWLPAGPTPGKPITVTATDSTGACVTGSFVPAVTSLNITHITPVTTGGSPQKWVVHVHNYGAASATVDPIKFDGVTVTTHPATPTTLGANSHLVLSFNVTKPKARGELYTVSMGSLGNGGRTPEARFPIEVWPRSTDCAFPMGNEAAASQVASHGIDTIFADANDVKSKCGGLDIFQVAAKAGPQNGTYFWITNLYSSSVTTSTIPEAALPYVLAFNGDEVDGKLDSNLRKTMMDTAGVEAKFPSILTYQGAKTNRNIGAYAGIADVQGVDAYVAGCAPTIIDVVSTLPIQYSYAYLLNARYNHMPLPAMTYSQLYGNWDVEPHGNEICLQIGSVLLSGAKGMTMFQAILEDEQKEAKDWNGNVRDLLLSVANPLVRETIRTGDIDGLPFVSSDKGDPLFSIASLSQVIRSPDHILIVIVNTDASGYSNLLCHVYASAHWKFADHTMKLTITITPDAIVMPADVAGMKEIVSGSAIAPSTITPQLSNNVLTLSDVILSDDQPVRLFMLPYTQAK